MLTASVAIARCPAAGCGAEFAVRAARLGRNVHCPVCRARLTARTAAIEERLAARPALAGRGDPGVARLPLAALIDNVRSLWNVGSILRTADACGVGWVVLTGITGHPPRVEISKTALGAEDSVAWTYLSDPLVALERVVAAGFVPVAIETTARAVALDAARWPERVCLVVGNEVAGVSPAVLEACPLHVRIPMRGIKRSLNVAVAFGIAAHAAARVQDAAPASAGACR